MALPTCGFAQERGALIASPPNSITIYFVRHGEVDLTNPSVPLSDRGFERADDIAHTLDRINLTHVFSSHTLRSRQAVEKVANLHGLSVVELPQLGSIIDGQEVNGVAPAILAAEPLSNALLVLPLGSTAIVGVNSDNVFQIMHNLGVPVANAQQPCELGESCVPCLRNTCFPQEFDNLWMLSFRGIDRIPELVWLRYGRP
jgi:hypothetical protein